MIRLTKELDAARQKGILDIYRNMTRDREIDKLGYVKDKLLLKLALLQGSAIEMEREISDYAEILFDIFMEETRGENIGKQHEYMLSALFYLCDPFDFFPDLSHEDAHLDDAFVINQCLSFLSRGYGPTYQRIESARLSNSR